MGHQLKRSGDTICWQRFAMSENFPFQPLDDLFVLAGGVVLFADIVFEIVELHCRSVDLA